MVIDINSSENTSRYRSALRQLRYTSTQNQNIFNTSSTTLLLDRGYTRHEHLIGVGLVNRNGRLYDPKLHRFLQPDNNIQESTNTQNFNRYAYCMNNLCK